MKMNTESRYDMKTKLERIAEQSKSNTEIKFNSIIHHINLEMLEMCHKEMDTKKAVGVDGVNKEKYGEKLTENLTNLLERMKSFSYRPQPVRRTYIPKAGSEQVRPLGIPAYEDRLVQAAIAKLLNAIYEPQFMTYSYGFRSQRGCHMALSALTHVLESKTIRYVVDADIKGFFDHLDHEWLIKFLEHKISDRNFIRLMKRILKANIMENGRLMLNEEGAPQGGACSPVLANIYLHYVLDLWFEKRIKRRCKGSAYLIRYADDFVCCFERKEEAEWFYKELKERMATFKLELAEEKSKIIMFGKHAAKECMKEGKTQPETFDFLGFTHYCSTDKSKTRYRVKRKTSKKKAKASRKKIKE